MWNWACTGVTILVVGSIVGSVPLRASVAFCNKFAGLASSREIPEPDVDEAMWILFVTILVNMVLGVLVLVLTGPGAVLTVGRIENSASTVHAGGWLFCNGWLAHQDVAHNVCPGDSGDVGVDDFVRFPEHRDVRNDPRHRLGIGFQVELNQVL